MHSAGGPGNFAWAEYEIAVVNNWDEPARMKLGSICWRAGGQAGLAEQFRHKDLHGRLPLSDQWVRVLPNGAAAGRVIVRREHLFLAGLDGARYAVYRPLTRALAAKVLGLIGCVVTIEIEVGSKKPFSIEASCSPPAV